MSTFVALNARDPNSRYQFLRAAYDGAFERLAAQTQVLCSLLVSADTDQNALAEAQRCVEQARLVYQNSRNLLVDFLLARSTPGGTSAFLT